ncbi:MAG: phage major capsid family protein [Wolbachia sp.]
MILKRYGYAKIQMIFITTYELYTQSRISQKLLDDAFVDVESCLVKRLPKLLVRKKTKPSLKVRALFSLKGL